MKLLHLTPKRNYHSILKYGLRPSKVGLSHHLETFQDDGLKGDKVIYLWDPDKSGETNKIIKDFIYCKHFIHPRNNMVDKAVQFNLPDIDFKKLGSKLFGEAENYVLLEIDSNKIDLLYYNYIHAQYSEGNESNSIVYMNPKYEHDNKILEIAYNPIFRSDIKLVNEISTRFYKDNTIGVSYTKI